MIGRLLGKITEGGATEIIIDVNGVGYRVNVPISLGIKLVPDETATLHVHTAVRENDIALFGFATKNDLRFFQKLITVPGIGPKGALNILNRAPVSDLQNAISSADKNFFSTISGIGAKTAEKIIIELKNKFTTEEMASNPDNDAILALVNLGYNVREARTALDNISKDFEGPEERIREALKKLA